MGAQAPLDHRLSDDHRGARRARVLFPARPQRRSDLHHQDHDRAGGLAGRDRRGDAEAGHRAARAQAAGDAASRFPAQLHARRRHHDLRQSEGQTTAKQVPDVWYHVRKSIGDIRATLPAGIVGPGFNDDFGDTFGIIYGFTADGFTHRELRDYVEKIRSELLHVADVSKIEILGAQDERIFVEFSMQGSRQSRPRPRGPDRGAAGAECGAAGGRGADRVRRPCSFESPAPSSPNRTCATSISSSAAGCCA